MEMSKIVKSLLKYVSNSGIPSIEDSIIAGIQLYEIRYNCKKKFLNIRESNACFTKNMKTGTMPVEMRKRLHIIN